VILFVYFLIAVSQFVLRRRTPEDRLTVKMWFFPVLTILAGLGIIAVLAQMFFKSDTRSQLLLSLLSWAVVLVLYGITRWRGGSVSADELDSDDGGSGTASQRIVVLANRTMASDELHDALERIDGSDTAEYFVVVPVNPVDTGQADREGAAFVWQATAQAARERLDGTLADLRGRGLTADGELGDYRPLVALDRAMASFRPDHVVIATQPEDRSSWLRHGVVADAREKYDVPVQHVVVHEPVAP
jgi:GABA permease